MSGIVRDIVETKQTNKVTGPYLDKSSLGGAIADGFITLADAAGDYMTNKAEDMEKASRGSKSGSDKNYTPLMNEAERIRSWIQQESPSIEAQQAEIARFNSNASALGFNPSDIKNVMEVSNLSPAKTATEEEMTRLAKQQQAEESMFRDVAVAEGISPDDPDVIEYGKATVINSQAAKTIIDSIPTYKDVATRERILRDNESILSRGLLSSFNAYKTKVQEVNTESIAAFKSQYVTALDSKGVPFSYARYLTDTYLAPYENTVKLFEGDKEKINAEIELQNKLRSNAEVQWFYNTVYPYKTEDGKTIPMTGAQIAAVEKLAPSTVKDFLDTGLLPSLPSALASNLESVPTDAQRKLVQPGTYGLVFNSIPTQEGKQKFNDKVRNPLLDKMNEAAKNASAEDAVKAKVETAPMKTFNNMSNGISAEDAKNDPTWNNTVEGIMQSQSGLLNKLFNGYGTALIDPNTGAIRYFTAEFDADGVFDYLQDSTNEGIVVPWGDQDAIQYRDSVAAELRQFMSNAIKGGMSRKEAADKWNMYAVMNSTAFRRYADAKRQVNPEEGIYLKPFRVSLADRDKYKDARFAVALDTDMSSEEAISIASELLGMKERNWKKTSSNVAKDFLEGFATGVGETTQAVFEAPGRFIQDVFSDKEELEAERLRRQGVAPVEEQTLASQAIDTATEGLSKAAVLTGDALKDAGTSVRKGYEKVLETIIKESDRGFYQIREGVDTAKDSVMSFVTQSGQMYTIGTDAALSLIRKYGGDAVQEVKDTHKEISKEYTQFITDTGRKYIVEPQVAISLLMQYGRGELKSMAESFGKGVEDSIVWTLENTGRLPGRILMGPDATNKIILATKRLDEKKEQPQDRILQQQRESGRVPSPQPNKPFEDGSYTNTEVAEVAPEGVFRETDKDNNMLVSVPADSKIQSPIEGSVVANAISKGYTTVVIQDPTNEELLWAIRGKSLQIPVTQGTKVKAGEVLGKTTGDTDISIGLYMADSSNFFEGNTVKLNAAALQRRGKVPPVQPNRR